MWCHFIFARTFFKLSPAFHCARVSDLDRHPLKVCFVASVHGRSFCWHFDETSPLGSFGPGPRGGGWFREWCRNPQITETWASPSNCKGKPNCGISGSTIKCEGSKWMTSPLPCHCLLLPHRTGSREEVWSPMAFWEASIGASPCCWKKKLMHAFSLSKEQCERISAIFSRWGNREMHSFCVSLQVAQLHLWYWQLSRKALK